MPANPSGIRGKSQIKRPEKRGSKPCVSKQAYEPHARTWTLTLRKSPKKEDFPPSFGWKIWWFRTIALHQTGQAQETQDLFDTLSNQPMQTDAPEEKWMKLRDREAE